MTVFTNFSKTNQIPKFKIVNDFKDTISYDILCSNRLQERIPYQPHNYFTRNNWIYLPSVKGCVNNSSQYLQNKTLQRLNNESMINIEKTLLNMFFSSNKTCINHLVQYKCTSLW
jgi:hypothetical protein